MRVIFAILSGVIGFGAAVALLAAGLQSTGRFSTGEVGIAIGGGIVAILLVAFAVRVAMMDAGFRARLKALRAPR